MQMQYTFKLKSVVEELKYEVLYESSDYNKLELNTGDVHRPGLQFAGFYGYFDPNRIQVVGKMECEYMSQFSPEERKIRYDELLSRKIPALVICHGTDIFADVEEAAKKHDVTILMTEHDTGYATAEIIRVVNRGLAPRITRHGVLVEIYGLGVLLLGESGIGKSETAIELLKRGHRLIADDAVEIKAVDLNVLEGTSPDLIRYYVELRGIGVIDVRQTFGVGAVKMMQNIHLVVNLEPWKEGMLYDRLGINNQTVSILDVELPSLTIPVRPGRNLAVILEVAAMNQRQKYMGYNAALEFTNQINKHFDDKMS